MQTDHGQLQPRSREAVARLIDEGVDIPNPLTLDIGPEVDLERISADGVTIYPGCRIYGAKTVISAGVTLGAEGPVTIEDCLLGPAVDLKAGSFRKSVFLEKANMGPGAQVRDACLLEEEANGAHCVGLKQTILLSFVTLGSLVNFCDCLMAGGTSRRDHSEVGSSYIHFNFTPDGDKTTPSLFGDVPRGVMLDQPRIFLGGQGGVVGPVRVGFGTVVAAGSVLRRDVAADGKLVAAQPRRGGERDYRQHAYPNLARTVTNNLVYLANLVALEQWYIHVRRPFFAAQDLGELICDGALEVLAQARSERIKRLAAMAAKVEAGDAGRDGFAAQVAAANALFEGEAPAGGREQFLAAFAAATAGAHDDYIATIQRLPAGVKASGVAWLQGIVASLCGQATDLLQPLRVFAEDQ